VGLWVVDRFVKRHRRPFTEAERIKIWLGCWGVWIFIQVGLSWLLLPLFRLRISLVEFLLISAIPILASGLGLYFLFGPLARKRAQRILKEYQKKERLRGNFSGF